MPRKYVRKTGACPRGLWTEDDLKEAFEDLRQNKYGINEISRRYGIPARTLKRRFAKQDTTKNTLGKHPVLDFNNEKRLVVHMQKLEAAGFPVTRDTVRRLAFEFAEKLGIEHNFNKDTRKAGPHWLQSFLERQPELSVRQAEGLSLARAQGLNRGEVDKMFKLLLKVFTENDLLDKPDRIFNIDETGVQLNNKPVKVIVTKGAKSVQSITSGEKGETMSIIACCNAAGYFLSPVVIIKGVNKKPEFLHGLPLGSDVYMNKKSAYVNTELFHKWLVNHFIPRKPQGKVVLILDGHSSHTNSVEMLETAEQNGIILFCLPSHSTQALQPLDRSFFKPLKTFYAAETKNWMLTNKEKKSSRLAAGRLIGNAWVRAATPANAIAGFRACGIYPYNPTAIPDHFFAISDLSLNNQLRDEPQNISIDVRDTLQISRPSCSNQMLTEPNCDAVGVSSTLFQIRNSTPPNSDPTHEIYDTLTTEREDSPSIISSLPYMLPDEQSTKETPSKYLQECSPIPNNPIPLCKSGKQSAAVLTSNENIATKKNKGKATPNIPCKGSKAPIKLIKKRPRAALEETDSSATCDSDDFFKENESHVGMKHKQEKRGREKKERRNKPRGKEIKKTPSDNTINCYVRSVQKTKQITKFVVEQEGSFPNDSSERMSDECVECFDDFKKTKSTVDWIQYIMCKHWLHETCTMYGDYCNPCKRLKLHSEKSRK